MHGVVMHGEAVTFLEIVCPSTVVFGCSQQYNTAFCCCILDNVVFGVLLKMRRENGRKWQKMAEDDFLSSFSPLSPLLFLLFLSPLLFLLSSFSPNKSNLGVNNSDNLQRHF